MNTTSTTIVSDFIVCRQAPPNRVGKHAGNQEEHLPEAAVMLAFALHLVAEGAEHVAVQPDGEHGKRFGIAEWFQRRGYAFHHYGGDVKYAGVYSLKRHRMSIKLQAGVGDVSASVAGRRVVAECKGGVINTKHAGQVSRLRKGLCEAVGLLMAREQGDDRHVAVVPEHPATERLARKMIARARAAGSEIALVDRNGMGRDGD